MAATPASAEAAIKNTNNAPDAAASPEQQQSAVTITAAAAAAAAAPEAAAAPAAAKPAIPAAQPEAEGDDDGDDDGEEGAGGAGGATAGKKKKKKNKKRAGASAAATAIALAKVAAADKPVDVLLRAVGKPPAPADALPAPLTPQGLAQTCPPTLPIASFFPGGGFPEGQLLPHPLDSNTRRTTDAEFRERELPSAAIYEQLREAGEAHRVARQSIQKYLRPGARLIDIAEQLETSTAMLIRKDGLKRGWGFPTGLSVNHIAAHWSPNSHDTTQTLKHEDVLKVDFGVHVAGRIIDCAFTAHFDAKYDPLVEAAKEATEAGVRAAGIDVRLGDVGAAIQEVMESYEIELNGRTMPIRCIRHLNGHSIAPYQIHAGKTVPITANKDRTRMEEGELYAIETFGSTGKGGIAEEGEVSHYMRDFAAPRPQQLARLSDKAKALYATIDSRFSTLAFCRRWLDAGGEKDYMPAMRELERAGLVNAYPPLVEARGTYTAQFEHTVLLRPTQKEVISRGFDY